MPQKYRNIQTEVFGIKFDSRKEANHYILLRSLEQQGKISDLRMQVPYELIPAVWKDEVVHLKTKDKTVKRCVQKATHYLADFVYKDKDGNDVVVDVKSPITRQNAEYRLKKKMMLAFKNIEIKEV